MIGAYVGGALALATVAGGCQTAGVSHTAEAHALGTAVPANYRALIAAYYRDALKDPYSVRDAGISAPRQEFAGLFNGGVRDAVCVKMNSKNSFGAYTGVRRSVAIFNGGRLAAVGENEFACRGDVEFLPFPELESPIGGAMPPLIGGSRQQEAKPRS